MKTQNILDFYEDQIRNDNLPLVSEMSQKDIDFLVKTIKPTLWFARWMLAKRFGDVIESIKAELRKYIK